MITLQNRLSKTQMQDYIAQGLTQVEVAQLYSVSQAAISYLAKQYQVTFTPGAPQVRAVKMLQVKPPTITPAPPVARTEKPWQPKSELSGMTRLQLLETIADVRNQIRRLGALEIKALQELESRRDIS